VRRSYHSQELVPVIIVIVAVAMAGHLKAALLLMLPGFGYWFWVLLQDRRRQRISLHGGVTPDGEDHKYPMTKSQVEGVAELFALWVNLESADFPLPPPVRCSIFLEDVADEEEPLSGSPEELFPTRSPEENSDLSVRRDALRQGLRTLLALVKRYATQEAGIKCTVEMMEAGVVELAMRAATSYHSDSMVVALTLELFTRMAWSLSPALDRLPDLLQRIQSRKLLGLMSCRSSMESAVVLRRGCQLLVSLSESVEVQADLLHGGGLQVVVTGMRRNPAEPTVAQWGCLALFHMSHLCSPLAEAEVARPGTLAALAGTARSAMEAHQGKAEVQSCGCMLLWSLVAVPERETEFNLRALQDVEAIKAMMSAHKRFPENAQITEIWNGMLHLMEKLQVKV